MYLSPQLGQCRQRPIGNYRWHHRRRLNGLGALGQVATITPQDAMQQAAQNEWSAAGQPGTDPKTWYQTQGYYSQVENGQIDIKAWSPTCAGYTPKPGLNLVATVGGMGLAATSTPAVTGAIIAATGITTAAFAAATLGIGTLLGIYAIMRAHHAAAVQQEQQLGCASIAAANNALSVINQAVQSGAQTPQQAIAALDSLYNDFVSYDGPSIKHSPCNAGCEAAVILDAIRIYQKSEYQAMADAQTASAPTSAATTAQIQTLQSQAAAAQASGNPTLAASLLSQATALQASPTSGIPSWMLWLGGGFLVWKLAA